jgi:hypothetical protein
VSPLGEEIIPSTIEHESQGEQSSATPKARECRLEIKHREGNLQPLGLVEAGA